MCIDNLYVCMYVCIRMYLYVYVCILCVPAVFHAFYAWWVYLCVCVLYVCMYLFCMCDDNLHVCMYVCILYASAVYVCMYLFCMYVDNRHTNLENMKAAAWADCLSICVYTCVYIHTYIYIYKCICILIYIYIYRPMVWENVYKHQKRSNVYIHYTFMHVNLLTCMYDCSNQLRNSADVAVGMLTSKAFVDEDP